MPQEPSRPALETVVVPRTRDLGDGFEVRRALPSIERRMVGPFVFLDQMGPAALRAGHGLDVRPHPHIGLATVTYLFDGEILHRDSLGSVRAIRPGEVNWMTAGRGIAHSERTPPEVRRAPSRLFGLQTWVALPKDREEAEPAFVHHGAADLPLVEGEGKRLRVVLGAVYGARSPVAVFSEMFYVDARLDPGARLELPAAHEERAVYIVEGRVALAGESFDAGRLLVLKPGAALTVAAETAARLVFLGGEPMDGPRRLWWNFVSSSAERIEQAKDDWRNGRFPPVPDDPEFIPLPESPTPVRYP
jgi:redox-sensitive bicupin YhaK (pirin superfamily)